MNHCLSFCSFSFSAFTVSRFSILWLVVSDLESIILSDSIFNFALHPVSNVLQHKHKYMCLVNHSQELKTRHNKVTNSLFNHIVTCKAILNYSDDVAISVSDKAN